MSPKPRSGPIATALTSRSRSRRALATRGGGSGAPALAAPAGTFALVCLACLAAAAILAAPAPPAAAQAGGTCPNAVIRAQQNAEHLPDCRAYEQVSPIDKNDTDIVGSSGGDTPGVTLSSAEGSAVAYTSMAAFAGSQAAGNNNVYASMRAESWRTLPLSPPIDPQTFGPGLSASAAPVFGASPDFSKQLVAATFPLAPGAPDDDAKLYVHDSSDDSYEFIAAAEGVREAGHTPTTFAGASSDGNRFYFQSGSTLAPDSTPPAPTGPHRNLYEWSNGELKLVGILPDGTVNPNGSKAAGGRSFETWAALNAVSDDGSRVYWTEPGDVISGGPQEPHPVYLRESGQTVLVSERQSDGSTQEGLFWYATPDGSSAFITSDGQLTPDASPAGADLYRYDADADELTDLTPDAVEAAVTGVLGASEEGSTAYFIAEGVLASGATAGETNLYAWRDDGGSGSIRFIGTLASGGDIVTPLHSDGGVGPWRVSPNGRYLGFVTASGIGGPHPQDPQPVTQAYLYDFNADSLACASCPQDGVEPSGGARLLNEQHGFQAFKTSQTGRSRNVIDSGRFFFESPDALLTSDTNGRLDVYAYRDGELELISSGQSATDSFFGDASRSGDDVFFLTRSQLVGQDRDYLYDLYDARVGGGIPAQNPPPPPPGCSGDECQGEPSVPPAAGDPASAEVSGPGNVATGTGGGEGASRRCIRLDRKAGQAKRRAKRAKRAFKRAKRRARRAEGQRAKRLDRKVDRKRDRLKKKRRKARRAKRKARSCGELEARRGSCERLERKADREKRRARRADRRADRAHGRRARRLGRKAERRQRQAKRARRAARECKRGRK